MALLRLRQGLGAAHGLGQRQGGQQGCEDADLGHARSVEGCSGDRVLEPRPAEAVGLLQLRLVPQRSLMDNSWQSGFGVKNYI